MRFAPEYEISKSMHALFHAAKLVELNDGYAIGDYSESPLEEKFQIALILVFNFQHSKVKKKCGI